MTLLCSDNVTEPSISASPVRVCTRAGGRWAACILVQHIPSLSGASPALSDASESPDPGRACPRVLAWASRVRSSRPVLVKRHLRCSDSVARFQVAKTNKNVCMFVCVCVCMRLCLCLCLCLCVSVCVWMYFGRGNALGAEGWGAVLGAAVGLAGLTTVEPLGAAWHGLMEGRLESLEGGKLKGEAGLAGVVAAGYLGRSASCLTRLDMGCPPLVRSLAFQQ